MVDERTRKQIRRGSSTPPALTWDRQVARWFQYVILFYMFLAPLEGLTCGLPKNLRPRGMVELRYSINLLPAHCGDSQVFFGWPIVAIFALAVSRRIEARCDASGRRWLTAGGRLRWIALWLVCFFCGTRLLNLIW